uniref:Mating-type homeodomain protein n=1 Tax=Coprinellus disseminatus TaxID=71703 RepID=Q1WMS4_COPDI|nr:mating-type homeodomain protein [Coprinellus disseminatus]
MRIINTSESLKNRVREAALKRNVTLRHNSPPPDSLSRSKTMPELVLPYLDETVENVRASDVPSSLQDRIIVKIHQWYEDVRRTVQGEYANTLNQLASIPSVPDAALYLEIRSFYESFYRQKAAKLNTEIRVKLETAAASIQAVAHQAKRPFNHMCLPLLQTYFEHNAYPSAQDRAMLARKSTLCPRQIEVWFQNHRRRAKKEGRRLERLSQDPLPHELNLDHLNASMPQLLVPKEETKTTPPKEPSLTPPVVTPVRLHSPAPAATHADNALCAPAPTHAFPTKYPPTPSHTSCLLSGKTWSFPAPEWPRRASVKAPTRKATITPDNLAVEFQKKLSITGSDGVKRTQAQLSAPAWYPLTTTLQPAPHFALIRKPTPASPPPAPTPVAQLNPTPRNPHPLRQKTSNLTKYKRPTPYQPRQPPKTKPLSRATSNSSLSSISSISSDESEIIRTPSPSPFARYIELPKEDFAPRYPDWEAYLVPP